ncbi:MAG: Xaa-Pro peptidase family protein [Candidatus Micrarchaeota archaeon]|nr:Xaa-Pro peptidase family protein [Candidatus Micrarchaeota archaeon]
MNIPTLLFNFNELGRPDPNFFYSSKLDLDNSVLLLFKNKKVLFTSPMNKWRVEGLDKDFEIKILKRRQFYHHLKNYLYKKTVGLDLSSISAAQFLALKKKFKLKPKDISQFFSKLRMVKSEEELKNIKKAVQITKKILNQIKQELRVGLTEIQVCNLLKKKALEHNVFLSFEPIVAADSSSKNPHHLPTNKKIEKFCLIDFGIKYNYYCAELTRYYFLKRNLKEEKFYKLAKKIFSQIVNCIPKSKNTSVFYKKVFEILKKHNWQNIPHAIGHGIGLQVHEAPFFSKSKSYPLKESMAIALEPAYYSKDFGVRFEENIVIKKNKVEIL